MLNIKRNWYKLGQSDDNFYLYMAHCLFHNYSYKVNLTLLEKDQHSKFHTSA